MYKQNKQTNSAYKKASVQVCLNKTVFRFLGIGSEAMLTREWQTMLAFTKKTIVNKWRAKLNKEKTGPPDLLSRFIDLGTEDFSNKDLTYIVLNFLLVRKQVND